MFKCVLMDLFGRFIEKLLTNFKKVKCGYNLK